MIIITGAAGFIGANIIKRLNEMAHRNLILVDDLNHPLKKQNIKNLKYKALVGIDNFWNWIKENRDQKIDAIIHLGACTDTLETNTDFLHENNVVYSQMFWKLATNENIPFIYASSAATYGDGSLGFSDDHDLIPKLKPLNPYAQSKQAFDLWALKQKNTPPHWVGLKYFNVYGPGEAHKGRMASVVWHFIKQLKQGEKLKLFGASHGYAKGEQKRDFIYVKDAVKMTLFMHDNKRIPSGIYNIGTGKAKSFNELAKVLFEHIGKRRIEYIKFPSQLKNKYQAYTCAEMEKIENVGYNIEKLDLISGIKLYYQSFNNLNSE